MFPSDEALVVRREETGLITRTSILRQWQLWLLVLSAIVLAAGLALLARALAERVAPSATVAAVTVLAPRTTPRPAPTLPPTVDTGAALLARTATAGIAIIAQTSAAQTATSAAQTATSAAQASALALHASATSAALAPQATAFAARAPQAKARPTNASAAYAPDLDALLLTNGYQKNIIRVGGRVGLRASQLNYSNSFWTRDLDYAISGYAYPLGNMSVFADNIRLFLAYVGADGVAPETIYMRGGRLDAENRESWDSMPNLIHAVYVYVAKTGDRDLYVQHRAALAQVGIWIVALDSDDDGLPDRNIFPFGYYDSVANGPLHTYALAKFYSAFNELAALEEATDGDGAVWRARAAKLRVGFHRPLDAGGYWLDDQAWPLAWIAPDGTPVRTLETFGVFEALRSGLIAPADGAHYTGLLAVLHERLPELIDGPTPMRLTLGGYEQDVRRVVDPPVPLWMLDNSAPWVVGLAAPAYAAAGYPPDAAQTLAAYATMARGSKPPVVEFAAGTARRYGAGDTGDRGRTWDSAAWFMALYEGHYGLHMTPAALIIRPQPFADRAGDGVRDFSYQGALVQLTLDAASATYRVRADQPIRVTFQPSSRRPLLRVNDGAAVAEDTRLLEPGKEYVITSTGDAPPPGQ